MTETGPDITADMAMIRVEQARLLKEHAPKSCLFVMVIIAYIAAAILLSHSLERALLWALPTLVMIGVTYAYAKYKSPKGITLENVKSYLWGHNIVTALTGLVWSSFAIYHADWNSYINLFISGTIVCAITIGGMLPGAAYRPAYIWLASFTLLPVAFHWVAFAPTPVRLIGLGLILYYCGGLFGSSKAEINIHDGIIARSRKILTDKVIEQNKIIKRAHDDKTRFMAATSHDLSQPLHAQGYFIQALKKTLTTPEQLGLLDKINATWRSQSELLEGLADITRLDSGVIIPKLRNFNLATEMQNLANEFSEDLAAKTLTLDTDFKQISTRTDPILLARIIRNILSNAVKFTPEGGHIIFSVTQSGDGAVITIEDDGPGIPETEHENIFMEYVQLNNAHRDSEQGLGLGLSIVRRLTSLLGIYISFTSVMGKGTRFNLVFPVSEAGGGALREDANPQGKFDGMPLIVLVDDDKAIREAMSVLLTDWGCQVICAATGADAIALLSETHEMPSLLLIDKRLANNESGIDLIHTLREEVNETTPAILMTGDLTGFDALKPETDITLLTKPVKPDAVKEIIKDVLAGSVEKVLN